MIEIPVTPYYFQKLAIYERVRKGDRLTSKLKTWPGEVILLQWSVRSHEHLYSSLTIDKAIVEIRKRFRQRHGTFPEVKWWRKIRYEDPKEMFQESETIDIKAFYSVLNIRKVFGNLAQRGLAEITARDSKKEPDKIRFTEKGRMWGDVLMDLESGNEYWYFLPLVAIRLLVIAFAASLFLSSLKTISLILGNVLSGILGLFSCSFNLTC